MQNIVYTFVEVQCGVFVEKWQGIAPNRLLGAILWKAGNRRMSNVAFTPITDERVELSNK